jgi:hypothetical protein
MPCAYTSELTRIELDSEDRLRDYRISKQSCGAAVGDGSLIVNDLLGRPISEILKIDIGAFCSNIHDDINRFLSLKHLLALQMTIEIFIGKEAGSHKDLCRIMDINYDEDGIVIEAEIEVNILAEKMRLCDHCHSGCAINKALKAG